MIARSSCDCRRGVQSSTDYTRPDQARLIHEALQAGLIARAEDASEMGLERLRKCLGQRRIRMQGVVKKVVELFAPLRGLELDFSRNRSTGRKVPL